MIDKKHSKLSIRQQCELLDIVRSNVYYEPRPNKKDMWLANEIHELWLAMPYYGYRRITAELQRRGCEINHKKVLSLMHDMNIRALYPEPRTTICNHQHKIYPYLLKDLIIDRPNQVWCTDITYIPMSQGFMYLVALIDVYSRYIIAWRLSNTLDTSFCLDMLNEALLSAVAEIVNTDQGAQFTSAAWIECLKKHMIQISMDGQGRWADNIYIERFWRTLKYEHVFLHSFKDVQEAKESIGEFINTYNHKRLHQSLDYKTPAEMYWL